MVLPAGIDVHTDLATNGSTDDFALGTKAALAGGTTTVIDVVVPESASESLVAAFDRVKAAAEAKVHCNLALSICVNRWSESVRQEMRQLVERGANSFILDLSNDSELFQAFEQCRTLGAHARILPENKNVVTLLEKRMLQMGIDGPEGYIQSRPAFLEGEQVHRMCVLSQLTNCPFSVLSVTSSQSCRAVAAGRSNGSLVNAEIAVAAFASEPNAYFDKDVKRASSLLLAAPVRTEARNTDDLMDLMANSPLCVCVSDHRAIKSSDRLGCSDFTKMPRGCPAAEERLSVLWEKAVYSGLIDPMRFVAIVSSNAAKIFNVYPKKGRIAVGADADIVVWDPKSTQQISSKTHWSSADVNVFEGLTVHAAPAATICEGRLVYQDGKMNIVSKGNAGTGRFIPLQPNSPHVFGVVQARERMNTPEKVERTKSEIKKNDYADSRPITGTGARGQEGTRSAFDSTFSVSGGGGDAYKSRASTKIFHPPGGKSTGFW
uniref:Amidohydro-rel domain-containing protein n=1 Tax=Steinernema glaseri TaxID=37863 RepID=A0A1I7ZAY8_9BILA